MAFQRPVCIRWRFEYSSAYRWSLGRTLSRIEKPWIQIRSTLAAVSPPSPYICCGDESPMLLVLYHPPRTPASAIAAGTAFRTQEHAPGHQQRWNLSWCKDRCLRLPVGVFTRPYWADDKEEEAVASLSKTNLGSHRKTINILHLLPLKTRYTKLHCQKQRD